MCANTYFDTICVQEIKMRTVKLTDKLEFVDYIGVPTSIKLPSKS